MAIDEAEIHRMVFGLARDAREHGCTPMVETLGRVEGWVDQMAKYLPDDGDGPAQTALDCTRLWLACAWYIARRS